MWGGFKTKDNKICTVLSQFQLLVLEGKAVAFSSSVGKCFSNGNFYLLLLSSSTKVKMIFFVPSLVPTVLNLNNQYVRIAYFNPFGSKDTCGWLIRRVWNCSPVTMDQVHECSFSNERNGPYIS